MNLFFSTVVFVGAAAGIWFCGSRLTAYADEISDRYRIGKAFMGFVFLAAATELPELVTTLSASWKGNAALALNNMFGGVALQTAVLVVADIVAKGAPLTYFPRRPTPMLTAASLVLLLSLLLAVIVLGERELLPGIGFGPVLLAVAYGSVIYQLRMRERGEMPWMPVTVPEFSPDRTQTWVSSYPEIDNTGLVIRFAGMSIAILGLGLALVATGEQIAHETGLGSSFVGATLLAGSTSLPELSTTVAAVRLKSYSMAISNILGSNLIMLALILPADIAYRAGPILLAADKTATFAIVTGIIVTVIYLYGLIARSSRQILGMGMDSAIVGVVYAASLVVFYRLV
ncbi:MAG: sodium:calcium antiporter [Hyphomicrobiaceae bacterium]